MRILVIGPTGTIGRAVVAALSSTHEVVGVSRTSTPVSVDLGDPQSIKLMFRSLGQVGAVVCVAGPARFGAFPALTDEDFAFSIANKLMGQANLVRYGLDHVRDGGSFVLTSGALAQSPMPGSGAISLVNAGLEGFARAAALEAPRGIRVNVVSPPWVSETLTSMGMDPAHGLPAAVVARTYMEAVVGSMTGKVLSPKG